MNGAESLLRTAVGAGVEVCFTNPGTTEMPLVAALDSVEGIRAILGLFEGVCTGAADGYARMADRPALTLLHLGPGFANGIANLHNARRARVPIVNLVGDQATWHLAADAPLTSDISSLARPVSAWIRNVTSARSVATDAAEAIARAGHAPGRISTLIVPSNCQWEDGSGPIEAWSVAQPAEVSGEEIKRAAQILKAGPRTALMLGGLALRERGLIAAGRIAEKSGCKLVCETFPARLERGGGLATPERLPYFPEQAIETLKGFESIILAGARRPVAFFGYPNQPSDLVPEGATVEVLARPIEDVVAALEALAADLGAPAAGGSPEAAVERPPKPTGDLSPMTIGAAIAALMPEGTIVMDEAATTGLPFFMASAGAPRHTYLGLTGGAIGQGLPCATGAAVACPDRRVIAFQADGGGMYTIQSLWTQAREGLNVTTLLCNNRCYRILQVELARAGVTEAGPKARSLTSLANPEIDWVRMARGMGVPAVRVDTADKLVAELSRALQASGPNFIEMLI